MALRSDDPPFQDDGVTVLQERVLQLLEDADIPTATNDKIMALIMEAEQTNKAEDTIPVYVQPPNRPNRQTHVGNVRKEDGEDAVINVTGVSIDRVIHAKLVGGKSPRWLVVALGA